MARHCDSALLVTLASELLYSRIWLLVKDKRIRLSEMNKKEKWHEGAERIVRVIWTESKKKKNRNSFAATDHRAPLVQGKFIASLARICVMCLAVHWSLGCIPLPLQSV